MVDAFRTLVRRLDVVLARFNLVSIGRRHEDLNSIPSITALDAAKFLHLARCSRDPFATRIVGGLSFAVERGLMQLGHYRSCKHAIAEIIKIGL